VQVFPGGGTAGHCELKFNFEQTIQAPNAADTKLNIKVMDRTEILAKAVRFPLASGSETIAHFLVI